MIGGARGLSATGPDTPVALSASQENARSRN